jgi:hypothetical protein
MRRHHLSPLISAGVLALLASCSRTDPRTARIVGGAPGNIANWRYRIEAQLPSADWHEFDAALQELKWSLKEEGAAANSSAVAAALAQRVENCTFNEVLRIGYGAKIRRLQALRSELKHAVDTNALLVTVDDASALRLKHERDDQQQRLTALDEEIRQARKRLVELGDSSEAPAIAAGARAVDTTALVLPRDEALHETNGLIARARSAAVLKYGGWPVKLDDTGAQLPAERREEFQRRRAAGEAAGRTVVAVHLRDTWRIFDAPVNLPQLSPAVSGNLTDADRKRFAAQWVRLQVELWARECDREAEQER